MTKRWVPRNLRDDGMIGGCEIPIYAQDVTRYVLEPDHEQALAEKDRELQQIREHEFQRGYQEAEEKYQQLMVQTVLFAKATISDMITEGTVNKTKAFLKEREGT